MKMLLDRVKIRHAKRTMCEISSEDVDGLRKGGEETTKI
jgi:hypothetical protein